MKDGDIFISDDGSHYIRWRAHVNAKDVGSICAICAFPTAGSSCAVDKVKGWSALVEAVKKQSRIATAMPFLVCMRGVFTAVEPLERELLNVKY